MSRAVGPRFRFTLRTMLVLLTAATISFGVRAKRAADQKRTVDWIVARGGIVRYDTDVTYSSPTQTRAPSEPNWLRSALGRDFFDVVLRVDLAEGVLDEATVNRLECLGDLRRLNIYAMTATDEVIDRLHRALPHVSIYHPGQAYLGVGCSSLQSNECSIQRIDESSPAGRAGLLRGDVIEEVGGKQVQQFHDLRRVISRSAAGEVIDISVNRDGARIKVDARLVKWSDVAGND